MMPETLPMFDATPLERPEPPLGVNLRELTRALRRHRPGDPEPFGPRGVSVSLHNSAGVVTGSVIVSQSTHDDGVVWRHASIARRNGIPPTYDDLVALKRGAFGDGYAYQVFAPADQHVNIHPGALHLWGRADGAAVLPEFGRFGTI